MYRPWVNRKFGVEIELRQTTRNGGDLSVDDMRESIADALVTCRLPARRLHRRNTGYFHSDGSTWDVKTDSSCGWEIASPVMYLDEQGQCQELREVCKNLREHGARVDQSCGLHIHIETPGMTWKQFRRLIRLWARYEPFFFSLVPPSRRHNSYCYSVYSSEWGRQNGSTAGDLHMACVSEGEHIFFDYARQASTRGALNLNHYWHSQRIEIRLHHGTVDALKIEKWAMLMLTMVQRAYRDDLPEIPAPDHVALADGLSVEYICRSLGLLPSTVIPEVPEESLRLVQWLSQRQTQFAQPQSVLRQQQRTQAVRPRRTTVGGIASLRPTVSHYCEAVMGLHVSQVYNGQPAGNCMGVAVAGQRFCGAHAQDVENNSPFRLIMPVREPSATAVVQ